VCSGPTFLELGRSQIPAGFEWSLPSLAAFVADVLDKAGTDCAHISGAKAGGAIAMQFAADYPARTRTLSVVRVPSPVTNARGPASGTSFASRRERLYRPLRKRWSAIGRTCLRRRRKSRQKVCLPRLSGQTPRKTASCSASKRRLC
jgi:pimeloyl-ACP methyl ester carboxylesterase